MREIWRFLAVVYGLGFAAECLAVHAGVGGAGRHWLKLAMWTPALAALSIRSGRRAVWATLRRSGGRWLVAGLAVGWSFMLRQQALLWATGGGKWNAATFVLNGSGTRVAAIHNVGMVLGSGSQGFGLFA